LIIIEHNLDIIAQADRIIDIGPGAGKFGGEVVFEGTLEDLLKNKKFHTQKHLKIHLNN
jgi:excinuclease UvrABC ATPase subunit